jgi:hypothetical protein
MIEAWARIAIGASGFVSIYLGYRLFCETRRVTLLRGLSGALLALYGMAILGGDVWNWRAGSAHAPEVRQTTPADAGSVTTPRRYGATTYWLT